MKKLLALMFLVACGGASAPPPPVVVQGTGGAPAVEASGGTPGTGGAVAPAASGGAMGTGGAQSSGGSPAASGGAPVVIIVQAPPPDPTPAPSNGIMRFTFTDLCPDGETYAMRFFDETLNLTWPLNSDSGGVYIGGGDGTTTQSTLACILGDKVCYGARPYPVDNGGYWGVDLDNSEGCIGCCYTCANMNISYSLTCH